MPDVAWIGRRSSVMLLLAITVSIASSCSNGEDKSSSSPSCRAMVDVAPALRDVRDSEGQTAAAAASFAAAARAFERTVPPAELREDWSASADALHYYAQLAAGQGNTMRRRSEPEVQMWRMAFARITAFGIDKCGMGWRTAFDDCREGSPPPGAADTRLLFPCTTT
jgi:hypothetical protein